MFKLHPATAKLSNTLNTTYKKEAIWCLKGSLSAFGYGRDLRMFGDQSIGYNFTDPGKTYLAPNGWAAGSEDANKYLAGSHKFKIKEIEVFTINFL